MALKVLNVSGVPIGNYDCVDSELTSFKGGEVCSFKQDLNIASGDLASSDSDGYSGTSVKLRPAVSKVFTTADVAPLFLSDDGTGAGGTNSTGYGTLFGTVIGGVAGRQSTGTDAGPHTAYASGKITLHCVPGIYGVTLDAVDQTNLVPSVSSLNAGDALSYTTAGLLTTKTNGYNGSSSRAVGNFIEFDFGGSYVSTPAGIVSSLNSPSGSISSVTTANKFAMVVLSWNPTAV